MLFETRVHAQAHTVTITIDLHGTVQYRADLSWYMVTLVFLSLFKQPGRFLSRIHTDSYCGADKKTYR